MKTVLKVSILGLFVLSLVYAQPKSVYAVDIIYWTDKGTLIDGAATDGAIYEIKTDGTGFKTVINTTILQSHSGQESVKIYDPSDVVIDNRGAQSSWKIYWTDSYGDNTFDISRANYDGSGYQVIKTGLGNAGETNGLDIDLSSGKLYYSVTNDVRSINLNGTGDATTLGSGVLSGLNPDPSGPGFISYVPVVFEGIIFEADSNGYIQEIIPNFPAGVGTGLTVPHEDLGTTGVGDAMTTNSAVSMLYDLATNVTLISFSDANDTIFLGNDTTDNAQFFASGLSGTYTLADVDVNTSSTEAYVIANSTSGSDGIYLISGETLTVVPNTFFSGNFSGMTIVNPELPPGMLGYLAMMLSFMVVWLRSRFHFHH